MVNYEKVKIGNATLEKNEGHEVYHFTCGTVSITVWPTFEMILFSGEKPVKIERARGYDNQVWLNP